MASSMTLKDYSEKATAKAFGLTASEMHLYATSGLLQPKDLAGIRYYSETDRVRLAVIHKAMRLGFSIGEVRQLLANRDRPDQTPKVVEKSARTVVWSSNKVRGAVERSRILIEQARLSRADSDRHVALIRLEMVLHLDRLRA